jgi:putative ABC transport system permease protein
VSGSALLACLRIARRDARRAPGRSALVVAMVALPVLGMTSADVLFRTSQLDPSEVVTRDLGQADVTVADTGNEMIVQTVDGSGWGGLGTVARQRTATDLARLVPGAVRWVVERTTSATVTTRSGTRVVGWREVDQADPLLRGTVRQVTGRPARTTGEVTVTTALARSLRVAAGGTLVGAGGRSWQVVGTIRDPHDLVLQQVVGLAGSAPPDGRGGPSLPGRAFVQTSAPVTWHDVLQLNRSGVLTVSRAALLRPPPSAEIPGFDSASARNQRLAIAGVILLVVGLATLEVVLLAGAAFAVGARSQRRSLALLSVAGGESRHVRGVVLAGGVVLGAGGAVVGIVLGGLATVLSGGWFERAQGRALGHVDLRPLELLGIALVGTLTGLLAAVLPARGAARADVVSVLAGRAGVRATPLRVPLVGLLLVAAGVGLAVLGEAAASTVRSARLILVGTIVVQLGALVLTPALVGLSGRLGRRLPLPGRLALRDAARHRGRTSPAVGAIMAAVAGSTALAVYAVSDADHSRRAYQPASRTGVVTVQVDGVLDDAGVAHAVTALGRALPAKSTAVVRVLGCAQTKRICDTHVSLESPVRCDDRTVSCGARAAFPGLLVGGVDLLRTVTGRADPVAEQALRSGSVVVLRPGAVVAGTVTLQVSRDQDPESRHVRVPAVQVDGVPGGYDVIVPVALAQRTGPISVAGFLVDTTHVPTQQEMDRAQAALDATDLRSYASVERGWSAHQEGLLLSLLIGTSVITLGAAGVATGLAAADGRADLATLQAVGAAPRTRRVLAGAQAATVSVLGTVLGVAVGFVPVTAYVHRLPGFEVHVPWAMLAAVVLVVPLLASLLAAAVTRPGLAVDRRTA